jgi:hypothetical protein
MRSPDATLLAPQQDKAVIKLLSATVPASRRADVELVLEAQRNNSRDRHGGGGVEAGDVDHQHVL